MTCVAMVLAGMRFMVPNGTQSLDATPHTLNAYLLAHDEYHCDAGDCDNLVLNATDRLTGGRVRLVGEWPLGEVPLPRLQAGLASADMAYLAHVHNPETGHVNHFVLLTGYDAASDSFAVLDPYFNRSSYGRSNVSDLLMYELLPAAARVPVAYPLYKQCDPSWGADAIHVRTVCAVGCLMSSTAMALAQRRIGIPSATATSAATPGSLNAWLLAHSGYVNGTDDLEEAAVVGLDPARIAWNESSSMHRTNDLTWAAVVSLLEAGAAVIANVMSGHHFVLVVGVDDPAQGDTLYVNDPGFDRPSYSFTRDVVGWRLFAITGSSSGGVGDLVAQLGAIAATAPSRIAASPRCVDDEGCSLNGRCVNGSCRCLAAWSGPSCGLLNLLPTRRTAGLHTPAGASPATSSWGGSVAFDPSTATYHMYAAESARPPAHPACTPTPPQTCYPHGCRPPSCGVR